MYVCDPCFKANPDLIRGMMTANGACEWCGHFHDNWNQKHVQWCANVRRPLGAPNPKKYILAQLKRTAPGSLAEAGVAISRSTAIGIRDSMNGLRQAHAGSDDPYKKGYHDAMDFMIRQIDQDLEREST